MKRLEMQVDALMRLCTAEKEADRQAVREQLRRMLETGCRNVASSDPEYLIRQILLDIGAPDHLLGHPYVVEAILLAVEDRTYINNITFGLYPQLAATFDTTAARVERAIRNLIEVTWTRGDWDVLQRYFGNTICAHKAKPTNGEFIARLTNVVRQRIREAA